MHRFTKEYLIPILPHPSRPQLETIACDSDSISIVTNPISKADISIDILSIDDGKTKLDICLVIAAIPDGYLT